MCELRTEIARLTNALARAEAQLAAAQQAVQQGVQPSPEATSIAPTFMTNDQAIAWAWADVRKDVGTENWTTGDSCNFYGFFLHGWNYRGQYELQRNATKAAVMREIADTCDYELQQAPAHPAEGAPEQAAEVKIGQLLALARIMVRAALDADNKTEMQEIKAAIESEVAFERALRAALTATQPAAQGMDAEYQRGYQDGYNRRDAEVKGALV